MKKKPFSIANIIGFLLGLLLIYLLLLQIDVKANINLLWKIDLRYLLAGAVFYLLRYFVRTLRFRYINQGSHPINFFKLLKVVFATSLASQTLPFRLGDLSYVYLTRRDNDLGVESGVLSILMIRIFDLFSTGIIFLGGIFFLKNMDFSSLYKYIFIIAGFILMIVLMIAALLIWNHTLLELIRKIIKILLGKWEKIHNKVLRFINNLDSSFDDLHHNFNFLHFSVISITEWLLNYFIFYLLLLGLSIDIQFPEALIAVTFAAFASILPINSFGNFGTQEAGWSIGLILLGFSKDVAVMTGFASHIYTLIYIVVFGGLSWLLLIPPKKNRP